MTNDQVRILELESELAAIRAANAARSQKYADWRLHVAKWQKVAEELATALRPFVDDEPCGFNEFEGTVNRGRKAIESMQAMEAEGVEATP